MKAHRQYKPPTMQLHFLQHMPPSNKCLPFKLLFDLSVTLSFDFEIPKINYL